MLSKNSLFLVHIVTLILYFILQFGYFHLLPPFNMTLIKNKGQSHGCRDTFCPDISKENSQIPTLRKPDYDFKNSTCNLDNRLNLSLFLVDCILVSNWNNCSENPIEINEINLSENNVNMNQSCQEESENINGVTITWPRTETSSSVLSHPHCVDENQILVKRTCLNGYWRKHKCNTIQVPFIPKCFDNHIWDNNSNYCIHTSKPQPWTSEVPVFDVEPVTNRNIRKLLYKHSIKKELWLPVKRTEKYGKFVWTIPKNYYHKFNLYQTKYIAKKKFKPEFVELDCMVMDLKEIAFKKKTKIGLKVKPEDCNKNHRTVHVYKPESRYYVKGRHLYYSTGNNNAYYLEKSCQTLAEPKTKEDNFIIKKLVRNRICKIGIDKINGTFIWKSSNIVINHTDWLSSTDFDSSIVVITNDGWKLINKNIKCSVCQIDHTEYKTELNLKPNIDHSEIILTAYSFHKISTLVPRTVGLEDLNIKAVFVDLPVYNNFTLVKNKIEKLDVRKVMRVDTTSIIDFYLNALILPNAKKIETEKIYLKKGQIEAYSFILKIERICQNISCDPHYSDFYIKISHILLRHHHQYVAENLLPNNVINFKAIKIKNINQIGDIEILFHLETNNNIRNVTKQFSSVKKILEDLCKNLSEILVQNSEIITDYNISSNTQTFKVSIDLQSIKNCLGCLSESTNWEFTEIGQIDEQSCTNKKDISFYKKCGGNHIDGGKWDQIKFEKNNYSDYTTILCKLYNKQLNLTPNKIMEKLSTITLNAYLLPIDINFISRLFQNITQSSFISKDLKSLAKHTTLLINNLVASKSNTFRMLDKENNPFNYIVSGVEKFLPEITKNILDESGVNQIIEKNFMYFISDPLKNNITGLALIRPIGVSDPQFFDYTLRYLTANMTIEEITSLDNLETAIYVPEILLNDIKNKSENKDIRISISFYYNDALFGEKTSNKKVFSVYITGYDNYLYYHLPIITKLPVGKNNIVECAFWDWQPSKIAKWQPERNLDTEIISDMNLQICYFKHLTNFALLLGNQTFTVEENNHLEILTAVGCSLSILGICGIYLTAILFKSWRQKVLTKLKINISTCILLQIIVFYSNTTKSEILCLISGSLLHYLILCGFSWSVIMTILQYIKFIRITGPQATHLLLKACLGGWFLPLIPVIIFVILHCMNVYKYIDISEQIGYSLCYPQGIFLYYTLLLPVSIAVFVNFIFFFLIFCNTCRSKIQSTLSSRRHIILQIKHAVFLFFLLGLTWMTGIINIIFPSIECLYFFTTTASLQGFALFIFYVVLNPNNRNLWRTHLESMFLKKNHHSRVNTMSTVTNTVTER